MTHITDKERGNKLLSGFGTDNYLEDFFTNRKTDNSPVINVSENDSRFKIELGIPGYQKENLSVNLKDSHLIVQGKHENEEDESKEQYRRRQFGYSNFHQSFELPKHVKLDKIHAKYESGILKILVPKKEDHQPTSATIKIS